MKKENKKMTISGLDAFTKAEGKLSRNDGIVKSGCGVHKPKKGKGSYTRKSKFKNLGF